VAAQVVLSTDGETVCITPAVPFVYGETVSMNAHGLKTASGKILRDTALTFTIRNEMTEKDKKALAEYLNTHDDDGNLINDPNQQSIYYRPDNTLTDRAGALPSVLIYTNNNPSPGNIYFNRNKGNLPQTSSEQGYGIIQSNGDSVFYRSSLIDGINFHINLNGQLTAYRLNFGVDTGTIVLDSNYNVIQYIKVHNQSQHEELFFKDGTKWFTAYDWTSMDLSQFGGGGTTPVNISEVVRFDANNNQTFIWRSIDHFRLEDAAPDIFAMVNQTTYDPWHLNAMYMDHDGRLIASFRNMDLIVKINPANGHIIWYWPGSNNPNLSNQYQPLVVTKNDPNGGFSHQHNVHRIANGDIVLFDNGNTNLKNPGISQPKEYSLDESSFTANNVWYYTHPLVKGQQMFTQNQGSIERMPNGNTLIGYGLPKIQGLPNGTEIDANKNIVWEFRFRDSTEYSYRVIKDGGDVTGIANVQKGYENIQVFPNPGHGMINLKLDIPGINKVTFDVVNELGQTVYSRSENVQPGNIALDLSAIPKGSYLLKISSGDKKYVATLTLQ
jgi:hypothetical protein